MTGSDCTGPTAYATFLPFMAHDSSFAPLLLLLLLLLLIVLIKRNIRPIQESFNALYIKINQIADYYDYRIEHYNVISESRRLKLF